MILKLVRSAMLGGRGISAFHYTGLIRAGHSSKLNFQQCLEAGAGFGGSVKNMFMGFIG